MEQEDSMDETTLETLNHFEHGERMFPHSQKTEEIQYQLLKESYSEMKSKHAKKNAKERRAEKLRKKNEPKTAGEIAAETAVKKSKEDFKNCVKEALRTRNSQVFNETLDKLAAEFPAHWAIVGPEKEKKLQKPLQDYREEYKHRHADRIDELQRAIIENREDNIGVIFAPHDARQWSREQREEIGKYDELYRYIHDKKDFGKFDECLARHCELYKNRVADMKVNCACMEDTVFTVKKWEQRKTPIHVAIASGYREFLRHLSRSCSENKHMFWVMNKWLGGSPNPNRLSREAYFTVFNIVINLESADFNPMWKLLHSLPPFSEFVKHRYFRRLFDKPLEHGIIKTSEYLQSSYQMTGLSHLVASGHFIAASDHFMANWQTFPSIFLPNLLCELALTGNVGIFQTFGDILLANYLELDDVRVRSNLGLLFPPPAPLRPDSVFHVAVRRGNAKMLRYVLNLFSRIYETRRRLWEEEFRNTSEEDMEDFEDRYRNYNENGTLKNDLERVHNTDQLNALEFAISKRNKEMVAILMEFGMEEKPKYKFLRWYVALMNGEEETDDLVSHVVDNAAQYPHLKVLTALIYGERYELFQMILLGYVNQVMSRESLTDIDYALVTVVFKLFKLARAANLLPKLEFEEKQRTLKKLLMMLLMAGAEIPDKKRLNGKTTKEILKLFNNTTEARAAKGPLRPEFCALEEEVEEKFRVHFGFFPE